MVTVFLPLLGAVGGAQDYVPWAALARVQAVVERTPPGRGAGAPVWRQTQGLWNAAWGQETFGLTPDPDAGRSALYRFRVPPDADAKAVGGKSPFMVEQYVNGLPTWGIRRVQGEADSLARPLGFRYGGDGLCDNVSAFVLEDGRWRKLRLSRAETTLAGKMLTANEYTTGSVDEISLVRFGTPWLRIVAQGYGEYWIDRDVDCVGPFGAGGKLSHAAKEGFEELIAGKFAAQKKENRVARQRAQG